MFFGEKEGVACIVNVCGCEARNSRLKHHNVHVQTVPSCGPAAFSDAHILLRGCVAVKK